MNNRRNAYTEVYTILQDLDEEEYNKIPPEVIKAIEENRNLEYDFELDDDLELKEQTLLPQTKAILFNLFRYYLATPEQKEKIIKMQMEERQQLEEKKMQQYNVNNIFKKDKGIEEVNEESVALVEIKKDSFITKLINKIKSFFKR